MQKKIVKQILFDVVYNGIEYKDVDFGYNNDKDVNNLTITDECGVWSMVNIGNDVIDFDCLYRLAFEVNVKGSKNEATYSHYAYALDADGEWLLYGNTSFRLFFYDAWMNQTELDKDIANGYTLYAGDVVF